MKRLLILTAAIAFLFQSCTKDEIPAPDASFEMYTYANYEYNLIELGVEKEKLYFKNSGEAEYFVLFTGQKNKIYSDSASKGLVVIKDTYVEVLYRDPGDYEVTMVATNVDDYGAFIQETETKIITIVAAE